MSRTPLMVAGLATLFVAVSTANAQPPGGGFDRGGDRGSRSGFSTDPNERFNQLSGGKDVIVIDQITDERAKWFLNMMMQRAGITSGQLTRDQYKTASEQFRSQRGSGGPGGGPPGGGLPGGGPPGGGFPGAGQRTPEQIDQEAEASFRKRDKDNDGMLRTDEMSDTLRSMVATYDKNKDGMIDLNEYKSYYRDRQQQKAQENPQQQPGQPSPPAPADGLPPEQNSPTQQEEERRPVVYRVGKLPKELPAWFAELDTDKDGQVGLYEWVKGGRPVEEFKQWDRNDDGLITVEEVLGYVKNGNKQPGTETASASAGGDDRGGRPSRGGPPGSGGMGSDFRSRMGGGPPGSGGGPPSFGRSMRPGSDSAGSGGPQPSGDTRSRGDSPGYAPSSKRSKHDRGSDGSRSDTPPEGKDKKDKKDKDKP
jgi:Ca2+-binding EF-hand superfamily protein